MTVPYVSWSLCIMVLMYHGPYVSWSLCIMVLCIVSWSCAFFRLESELQKKEEVAITTYMNHIGSVHVIDH